jgi:hypothetical protein
MHPPTHDPTTPENPLPPIPPHIDAHTSLQFNHTAPTTAPSSLWQPPEDSNLRWVWIEDEEPFLTNATLSDQT